MALAWKAGWVHALTSSNLVSSATVIMYARVRDVTQSLGMSPRAMVDPARLMIRCPWECTWPVAR